MEVVSFRWTYRKAVQWSKIRQTSRRQKKV